MLNIHIIVRAFLDNQKSRIPSPWVPTPPGISTPEPMGASAHVKVVRSVKMAVESSRVSADYSKRYEAIKGPETKGLRGRYAKQ